jgi:hypothetical protein
MSTVLWLLSVKHPGAGVAGRLSAVTGQSTVTAICHSTVPLAASRHGQLTPVRRFSLAHEFGRSGGFLPFSMECLVQDVAYLRFARHMNRLILERIHSHFPNEDTCSGCTHFAEVGPFRQATPHQPRIVSYCRVHLPSAQAQNHWELPDTCMAQGAHYRAMQVARCLELRRVTDV